MNNIMNVADEYSLRNEGGILLKATANFILALVAFIYVVTCKGIKLGYVVGKKVREIALRSFVALFFVGCFLVEKGAFAWEMFKSFVEFSKKMFYDAVNLILGICVDLYFTLSELFTFRKELIMEFKLQEE